MRMSSPVEIISASYSGTWSHLCFFPSYYLQLVEQFTKHPKTSLLFLTSLPLLKMMSTQPYSPLPPHKTPILHKNTSLIYNQLITKSMSYLLSSLLGKQLNLIIQHKKCIDVRVLPSQLLKELGSQKGKNMLVQHIRQKVDQERRIRVFCVLGLLIIYSDDFYQLILQNLEQQQNLDSWVKKEILDPFIIWLKKCCETSDLFKKIKKVSLQCQDIMDRMPYTITLLDQLLHIVQYIPKFGRYFNLDQPNKFLIMFSEVLMILTNMLYSHLKKIIDHLLIRESREKVNHHRQVLKWIFCEKLPWMNDVLVKTTLNKYFTFHKRGIVTKTIKIQDYDKEIQSTIGQENSEKSRSTVLSQLQEQIFPQDGSFNEDLYISTLQGSFNSDFASRALQKLNKTVPYLPTHPKFAFQHRLRK